jgi:hypothetical protein
MRGITARLGKGFFDPVASPTKESLRALLWNLQSRGFPSPCTLDRDDEHMRPPHLFVIPPKELSRSLGTHRPLFAAVTTKGLSCPLEPRPKSLRALWKPDRGLRTPAPRQAFRACDRPRRCLGTLHYRRAGGDRK